MSGTEDAMDHTMPTFTITSPAPTHRVVVTFSADAERAQRAKLAALLTAAAAYRAAHVASGGPEGAEDAMLRHDREEFEQALSGGLVPESTARMVAAAAEHAGAAAEVHGPEARPQGKLVGTPFDHHLAALLGHRVIDAYLGDLVTEITETAPGAVRVRVWGPLGCGEVSAEGGDVDLALGALAGRCRVGEDEIDDYRAAAAARQERHRLLAEGAEP